MAGPGRNDGDAGGETYRVHGNRMGSATTADAVLRLWVARDAAYAIDDLGRAHVFDAHGALTGSVDVGPFADAALHDGGAALAVAAYGHGVTSIHGGSKEASARRVLSHPAAVLCCAGSADGLLIGDQGGAVTLLQPEMGAARTDALELRAPILSIASSGTSVAVLTADGEVLTGPWPRSGALTPVRGLRAKRPYRVLAEPGKGFIVVDRERVHAIRGDEVARTSRDFPEGILAFEPAREGGFLLTDTGRVHALDDGLRAGAALALGVHGRPRGIAAIGDRAAVWTTRGELVSVDRESRVRGIASENVLAAGQDPRTGDLVAVHSARGLALRRHPISEGRAG